jgi:hypothetical protein
MKPRLVSIPVTAIAEVVCAWLAPRQEGVTGTVDPPWFEELKKFTEELNGKIWGDEIIGLWAIYGVGVNIPKDEVKSMITQGRKEVAEKWKVDLTPSED